MDITYCYEQCTIGKTASDDFLRKQSSVFDAAIDFQCFTEKCFKTCPYKTAHVKNKTKES